MDSLTGTDKRRIFMKRQATELDTYGQHKRFKVTEEAGSEIDIKKKISNSNEDKFPLLDDGSTLHLNIKPGDVANRVLSVGDTQRAIKLSKLFDKPEACIKIISTKTFRVFTGTFRNVPVSIIATGMGLPMMDFVVREVREVVDGPIAMMRYGTCGVIDSNFNAGDVLVASKGCVWIKTNYDQIANGNYKNAYTIFKPAMPDLVLCNLMIDNMREIIGKDKVKAVMNWSADSFYGSEGRPDYNFIDANETLIDEVKDKYPDTVGLEMETFCLYHLGQLSKEKIHTCAAAIGLIKRDDPANMLSVRKTKELEDLGGLAILKSLAEYEFPTGEPDYTVQVLENIRNHESKNSSDGLSTQMAINRIMDKNPEIKKALDLDN